ncbi:NAD(P)/FAD-dependent oxidoreductase [Colwellia psychrerythraea]|uniref:Rubredoxin--NAD(+) reductase n=1 Tax=Colwellia psychrerythraea TaxID=28229 RepID=A0A099KSU7_COLPS|nr:FAD-dependent oxidoreductase [Colwellia psychrerythraea]KGJ93849.1 Rubredoxin--NAD(+) reductase [Colwellia psychrerythraea]
MSKLVIIGNGIAGVTVARHVRKRSDIEIMIISAETEHFFSRTALMYIFMGHMTYEHTKPYEDCFWQKNRIDLKQDYVDEINTETKVLTLASGEKIDYSQLVMATGSQSNKFGWPGQDLPGVQTLFNYQDLLLMEENSKHAKHAVIVGGGLIGVEMAEMLISRGIEVTFLVREERFWGNILPDDEAKLVQQHAEIHGVHFKFSTELNTITAGNNGRVNAITTSTGEELACDFVGLSVGVHPSITLAAKSNMAVGRGILVNDFLETNIADVYAVGDCAEIEVVEGRNRIEPLWYTGKMQGETLARTITGDKTKYDRGIWFNSAKFFDVEYQTYGFVANEPIDGIDSFYWQHPKENICVRITYQTDTQVVTGVNTFGIRMRHNIWQHWLSHHCTLKYVLQNLRTANFDPELFRHYEKNIITAFNKQYPSNKLTLSPLQWLTKRFTKEQTNAQ